MAKIEKLFFDENDNLLNYNGQIAAVVHQYDRKPSIYRRLKKKYDGFNITTLINKMKRKKIKQNINIFIPTFIFFMLAIFFKYFLFMKFNFLRKNKMSKRKLKRIKIKFIKKRSFKNKYKKIKSIINFI